MLMHFATRPVVGAAAAVVAAAAARRRYCIDHNNNISFKNKRPSTTSLSLYIYFLLLALRGSTWKAVRHADLSSGD